MKMWKRPKEIYAFIANPFHKFWIEDAAKDIRYEKRYNFDRGCMMYKIKRPKRDGFEFLRNLNDILESNDEQICVNRKNARDGYFVLWDKEFDNA